MTLRPKRVVVENGICTVRDSCRICGSPDLVPVIDLGEQYIASIFVKGSVPEPVRRRYPLEVVRCFGRNSCGLVQLRHTVSPSVLYSRFRDFRRTAQ